jgi:hypothetical protein
MLFSLSNALRVAHRPPAQRMVWVQAATDVDVLVTTCSIFCSTPSLGSMLINKFRMRPDVQVSLCSSTAKSGVRHWHRGTCTFAMFLFGGLLLWAWMTGD